MGIDNSFFNEVKTFVGDHKAVCILTLGLAIVGFSLGKLAGRAVAWIRQCYGTSEKTSSIGQKTISKDISSFITDH